MQIGDTAQDIHRKAIIVCIVQGCKCDKDMWRGLKKLCWSFVLGWFPIMYPYVK